MSLREQRHDVRAGQGFEGIGSSYIRWSRPTSREPTWWMVELCSHWGSRSQIHTSNLSAGRLALSTTRVEVAAATAATRQKMYSRRSRHTSNSMQSADLHSQPRHCSRSLRPTCLESNQPTRCCHRHLGSLTLHRPSSTSPEARLAWLKAACAAVMRATKRKERPGFGGFGW